MKKMPGKMRCLLTITALLFCLFVAGQSQFVISREKLQDKIRGGWAGQTIGVTLGGPYEFGYQGSFINDYVRMKWDSTLIATRLKSWPGLYDDLYMDLTFVEVFEKYGLNAPVDSFASAFANAGYDLWHANQAARYNILHGIAAPQSGSWKYNPHADCIDYQIESDFAGLMSPAMPNAASAISDKIGHIMNYGDGWYGGVYVSAMYALAFTSGDIEWIVNEGLKAVPARSEFYQCIADVIRWHKQYPRDWKQAWFEIQKKWADEVGCPDGVFAPFNIDAKINAAYVVMGLLYGKGDFTKTIEIATRCGQDADCNPSTAGGILGTVLGYQKIPARWKNGMSSAEDIDFKYTTMSLNDVYAISFEHALKNITANGGEVNGEKIVIKKQTPVPVKFERGFKGIQPVDKLNLSRSSEKETSFEFDGTGFVIRGEVVSKTTGAVLTAELYIDGELAETIHLPAAFAKRRTELAWKYDLVNKHHSIKLKVLNSNESDKLVLFDCITYTGSPEK